MPEWTLFIHSNLFTIHDYNLCKHDSFNFPTAYTSIFYITITVQSRYNKCRCIRALSGEFEAVLCRRDFRPGDGRKRGGGRSIRGDSGWKLSELPPTSSTVVPRWVLPGRGAWKSQRPNLAVRPCRSPVRLWGSRYRCGKRTAPDT